MNTNEDPSGKVVDLKHRQAAQAGDRVGELLKLVRGIALKRVNGLVSTLFENVDDALFDLAERAQSNASQVQFFDGMREVRKKRQLVERVFQDQLSKIFADFADGKLKPVKPEVGHQGSAGLSLVDDQELEESLAISSMVAKAENRLARTLFLVNQRLAVINGGHAVEDASNPVGPAPLCQAFRTAVRELELNVEVKLIIYKLFDRYVMAGLEPLYDEVNAELIRAGVLPQIRHQMPSAGRGAPHGGAGTGPGAHAPAGVAADPNAYTQGHAAHGMPGAYDPVGAELQAELYETVRSLLASRRPTEHVGDFGGGYATGAPLVPNLSPTDLLNALSILQGQQTIAAHSQATSAADAAQAVQQIKQELLDQVRKLGGAAASAHHVSTADEDTIDLVGMLFEFILQDRNIPSEIQALLGRLQIPYLKIAILDKHLFAQKSHPARRLLDAMAEAGKGWSPEADADHRLHDRIKAAIDKVLLEFDDDLGIIEKELESFDQFTQQNRRRADLAEQRAAEVTRGREKLHAARRDAAREILQRIGDRELPPVVHNVLSRPWANYLVLTKLRHGAESDEWKNALRFADEFVWSAMPKTTEAEKARLRALLPQLEKALRHGLGTVAYHDGDVRSLMQELSQFYQRLVAGESVEVKTAKEVIERNVGDTVRAEDGSAPSNDLPASNQSPVEEVVLGTASIEPDPVEVVDDAEVDAFLESVRQMKVGNWIEFIDESGNRERAKLSWISPISSKYLFVNRRGLKVCDKTATALAAELRQGNAVLLEEVPLFDRALDAIVERLRKSGPAEGSAPTPPPAPSPA
ncbi:DUF1631 domain-containing protein [Dokdonella sp. MW10]|uniref:DUF1631 domain-containing protein n=1 Tax=Dokdonella sp. MW10 TaxID=2992926 RepID=UPI003F7FD10B